MAVTTITKPKSAEYVSVTEHPMDVHKGNAIYEMIHINKKPSQVAVELVQNALDERAVHIRIIVDAGKRVLWAYDDGDGVSKREILELWQNIGMSSKRGKLDQIGQKGVAKLANLSIAGLNTFVSRPRKQPGSGYFKIVIDKSKIKDVAEPKLLCYDLVTGFSFGDQVKFKATTLVRLDDLQKGALAEFAHPEQVAEKIGKAFAKKIRGTRADIQLTYIPAGKGQPVTVIVRPKEYEGKRQIVRKISTPYGPVSFEMTTTMHAMNSFELVVDYVNRMGGTWSFDLANVAGILDKREIADILGSGHFQGRIEVNFCTLEPDRQGFIDDDERDAFVRAVHTYTFDHAEPYLAHIKSQVDTDREQKVLEAVQNHLNTVFRKNPTLLLEGGLRTFLPGGIPAEVPKGAPAKVSRQEAPAMEDIVPPGGKKATPTKKPAAPAPKRPKRPSKPKPPAPKEAALGIRIVRKLANQEPNFSGPSYADDGTIFFNVEHEAWIRAAKNGDKVLTTYVNEHSAKEIAAMMIDNERDREAFLETYDEQYARIIDLVRT